MKKLYFLLAAVFTIQYTMTAQNIPHIINQIVKGSNATAIGPVVQSILRQNPLSATITVKTATFRVTFDDRVNGVTYNDFVVATVSGAATGSILSNAVLVVNGTGRYYDVAVTSITGSGTLRLDLKASGTGITNQKGQAINGGYTSGETYSVTEPAPTLTSVTIASGNAVANLAKPGDVVTLNFTASVAINSPNVSIATHTVTATALSSTSFRASYTMNTSDVSGKVPFSIAFSSTSGIAGTTVTGTTNGSSVTFDKTPPVVSSIMRYLPSTSITDTTTLVYRVTFNEKVTGVDGADFAVSILSGDVAGTISGVAASGTTGNIYNVTVGSISGSGNIRVDLKSSGTGINDAAGNAIATGFTSGEYYSIQTVAQSTPTLTSVTIASSNAVTSVAKTGDAVTVSFTASEPVNTPSITIAGKAATVTSAGGNSYRATYTMQLSDAEGAVPFVINFTSTQGVTGTAVNSTTNGSIVTFDRTVPLVVSVKRQNPLTDSGKAMNVVFRVTFSEKVNGVDVNDFQVTSTGNAAVMLKANAVAIVGTGGNIYDVTLSSVSGNGSVRLDLKSPGTGVADVAGNAITSGFITGETYTNVPGFYSTAPLSAVNLSLATKDKPQSKVWNYAGYWWTVLSESTGTKVFRLDGTTWTDVLTLTTKNSKPDCRIDGDLAHILLYRGALNNSVMYSLKYDPSVNKYVLWNLRPTGVNIIFPEGSETATMAVDGTGRMWLASDGLSDMTVRWSDAPYSAFSDPITIASGAKDDDICAIVPMPALNGIGLMWSNQITKNFGFRMHINGTDPNVWTADEKPDSAFAQNIGYGFADDHMNLKSGSDGAIYCAAKTSYNTNGTPKLILMIRRTTGVWDAPYIVTMNPEGTQPIVVLNEAKRKLKIVYATVENGGDIAYREASMDNILFSNAITLIKNTGETYDYASSTHQNYDPGIVIIATRLLSAPIQAVGMLCTDNDEVLGTSGAIVQSLVSSPVDPSLKQPEVIEMKLFPNPVVSGGMVSFRLPYSSDYELSILNNSGRKQTAVARGYAGAGIENKVQFDTHILPGGTYLLRLQTSKGSKSVKFLLAR